MFRNFIIALIVITLGSVGTFYLQGCKATQADFVTLKTIVPFEDYTVYKYSKGSNRLTLVDSADAHNFPDTIMLVKKH